jgi:hypothetical protein
MIASIDHLRISGHIFAASGNKGYKLPIKEKERDSYQVQDSSRFLKHDVSNGKLFLLQKSSKHENSSVDN